ncbi:MAG: rod-binding protein, partial [Ignavibacteria bacterium]|nr:rod-binding protein [Ignavibacteria bacterium]
MDGIKTDGPEHTPRTAVQRSNLDDKAKARLEKATREFEALFLSYMLKTMRGNQSEENGLFGDNFGGDLMTGMFDQELARHVTRGNSLGLGEMMYRSLTGEKYHQADRSTTKSATAVPQRPETAPVVRERKLRTAAPVPVPEIQSPGTTSPETPEEKPQPAPHATPELRTNPPVMAVPDSVQARVRVFNALIEEASVTHGVDSSLVRAIMASESGGRPDARSSKSAKGLMQLIDSTAAEMG